MLDIDYHAPPTCAAMMKSESFGRLIAGPVGSGKTTSLLFELFRRASEQAPAPDGKRYTRFAIVRQTLKQLKDTVLKDILSWLSKIAFYKVSDNTIYIEAGDIRSEWLLIPLEDYEDQRRLLSMQLTGAWMSEAIEMDLAIIPPLSGRCGRYPSAAMGGATWYGIVADTNMPSEGSDWHKFMALETPPDWQIFIQPGGMTEHAENLEWLTQTPDSLRIPPYLADGTPNPIRRGQGRIYYERLSRNPPDWVKRYVDAQYGNDPSGTAVFRESFRMAFHVLDKVDPIATKPLMIGQDFGRDPCSIICQYDHRGRLLVLQEVMAEDTGLELHVNTALRPALMDERYMGKPVALVGDPAGKAKDSIFEETSFDALKRLGFSAFPAPTNDIDARIRSVESFLLSQRDGGPAIVFDRGRCPQLVRAMAGGYRFAKTKAGIRKPLPDKNTPFSHIVDALEYVCLVAHGGMTEMMARHMMRRQLPKRPRMSAAAWT